MVEGEIIHHKLKPLSRMANPPHHPAPAPPTSHNPYPSHSSRSSRSSHSHHNPHSPPCLPAPMSYAATLKAAPPVFPTQVIIYQPSAQQQPPLPPPQHQGNLPPAIFHPGQPFRPNPSQPVFTPGVQPQPASSTSASKTWYPDVYTLPFIPQYLQVINTLPAVPISSLPAPTIQFHAFISSFCGSAFLRVLPPPPAIPPTPTKPTPAPFTDLTPSVYFDYFFNLISHEVATQHKENRKHDMFNEPLHIQDPSQSLYRLNVPGIRENTPMVQLGDVVKLRQVRIQPGFGPMGGGSFSGYQYDACVYGMDKTYGYIVLRVDHLLMESGRFNVCFGVQERRWAGPTRAIEDLGSVLGRANAREEPAIANGANGTKGINGTVGADAFEETFVRRMLFPEKADGVWQRSLGRGVFSRGWFDGELNYEQQVRLVPLMWPRRLLSLCPCIIRRRASAIKKTVFYWASCLTCVSRLCFPLSFLYGGVSGVKVDGKTK